MRRIQAEYIPMASDTSYHFAPGDSNRRIRKMLFILHRGSCLHRRRNGDGLESGIASSGYRIYSISSDRYTFHANPIKGTICPVEILWLALPVIFSGRHIRQRYSDNGRQQRRRRKTVELRGRILHGTIRAKREGSSVP